MLPNSLSTERAIRSAEIVATEPTTELAGRVIDGATVHRDYGVLWVGEDSNRSGFERSGRRFDERRGIVLGVDLLGRFAVLETYAPHPA